MSSRRPPAPAPQIPGFSYIKPLGTGGFSDVYLYEQHRPQRKVAIKVLLADVSEAEARARFEAEANLMAQLSTHPYIVTIYQAEITADSRSYLAMEYCSRPGLDARYRRSVLSVDEALSLGIQICSAVQTAHLAGIIHRDIKPANVLTTDYNRPALTDFGISGTIGSEVAGLSIPWSAPEAFEGGTPPGVRMDVYSLGATIYTVLAGHSPFVRPGRDNSQTTLIERITNTELQPLQRPDVPQSLNQALAVAMAKSPAARFGSAAELARSLQRIQAELGLSVTPFEVLEEHGAHNPADEEGESTRVRSVTSIEDAQRPRGSGPLISSVPGRRAPAPWATDLAGTPAPVDEPDVSQRFDAPLRGDQQVPVQASDAAVAESPEVRRKMPKALLGVALALALIVSVAIGANLLGDTDEDPRSSTPPINASLDPKDPIIGANAPQVTDLKSSSVGKNVTFTWKNPDPMDGDFYMWAPVTATETGDAQKTDAPSATLPRAKGQTCIEVKLVRKNGGSVSEPKRACTEVNDG
ncbi:serine/threonine-protein kinase [Glutamicibacter endophyticus]